MNPREDWGLSYQDRGVLVITEYGRRYLYKYKFVTSLRENPWNACKLVPSKEPLERRTMAKYTKIAPVETLEWSS